VLRGHLGWQTGFKVAHHPVAQDWLGGNDWRKIAISLIVPPARSQGPRATLPPSSKISSVEGRSRSFGRHILPAKSLGYPWPRKTFSFGRPDAIPFNPKPLLVF
jgi:hypothetical protein